jgi:hypothetical protein
MFRNQRLIIKTAQGLKPRSKTLPLRSLNILAPPSNDSTYVTAAIEFY